MTVSECIFVTGATGFIGAHCVGLLLDRNYRVKAHTRSMEKYNRLKSCVNPAKQYLLEPAVGSDITNYDELVVLMQDCTGVLHVASPFKFAVADFVADLLMPALEGTQAVMKAAHSVTTIKRVVLTSSFAAVYDASKGAQPGVVLTERDFSPLTWADGASSNDAAVAYRVSKTVAERAAWEYMQTQQPSYDLCVLCPTMVFGPVYSTKMVTGLKELNFSNQLIAGLLKSRPASVPATKNPVWVDVRDLAQYHVAALESAAASNQRFLISAGDYDNQEIVDCLRRNMPRDVSLHIPVGSPGNTTRGLHYTTDSSKGLEMLGVPYRSLESSVVDLAKQLLALT